MNDFGLLVGMYRATLPSLSDTQPSELQLDSKGRLIVSGRYIADTDTWAAGDKAGLAILAVRKDTAGTLVDTDGDIAPLQVDANGRLRVDAEVSVTTGSDKVEDSAHTTGDVGAFILGVRNDANAALTSADGDYSPIAVDSAGRTKVVGNLTLTPPGAAAYTVTDALAAAGDGLETITAALTPWVTVASLALTTGTAYVYGYQWACDQNAQMRIITDDTADIKVYKVGLNSSSTPDVSESWSESGRIEIAGAANLEIKMQIKKRNAAGGNANGTGSMHIRTV